MTASPPGPPREEQGVPEQQAMLRRADRNAASYGVERGRSGRNLSAPGRQLSRTPYRQPSNSQGNDTVSLVSRQPAQPGGNVDTYRGGASSGQGQTTALVSEMLTGAGQQQDAGDVSSMLPQWLEAFPAKQSPAISRCMTQHPPAHKIMILLRSGRWFSTESLFCSCVTRSNFPDIQLLSFRY